MNQGPESLGNVRVMWLINPNKQCEGSQTLRSYRQSTSLPSSGASSLKAGEIYSAFHRIAKCSLERNDYFPQQSFDVAYKPRTAGPSDGKVACITHSLSSWEILTESEEALTFTPGSSPMANTVLNSSSWKTNSILPRQCVLFPYLFCNFPQEPKIPGRENETRIITIVETMKLLLIWIYTLTLLYCFYKPPQTDRLFFYDS